MVKGKWRVIFYVSGDQARDGRAYPRGYAVVDPIPNCEAEQAPGGVRPAATGIRCSAGKRLSQSLSHGAKRPPVPPAPQS